MHSLIDIMLNFIAYIQVWAAFWSVLYSATSSFDHEISRSKEKVESMFKLNLSQCSRAASNIIS
jgi:hypothetical protein